MKSVNITFAGLAAVLSSGSLALSPVWAQLPSARPPSQAALTTHTASPPRLPDPVPSWGPAPQPSAPTVDVSASTRYRMSGEDVLNISVVNFPMLSCQAVVTQDGTISVPLLPLVSVAGKTTDEVAQLLVDRWRKYVVNPAVSVALTQLHEQTVAFTGYVGRPGPVKYQPRLRLLQALADAGGPLPTGDMSGVVVTHPDGSNQSLDLSHPETKAGTDPDVVMQVGDVIYIPEQRREFSVVGEVEHPGSFDYKENMTVLDALTLVGGVKDTGDLRAATLTHDGYEAPLDLDALLRQGDMRGNRKLAAGDRLMVPELHNRTYVFGAVGRPGYYIFKPGDRILDALSGVGGPLHEGDMRHLNLIHIDKSKNAAHLQEINLDHFLQKADLESNALLAPGDVIYIPDRRHTFQLGDLFSVLNGVNLLNNGAHVARYGLGY